MSERLLRRCDVPRYDDAEAREANASFLDGPSFSSIGSVLPRVMFRLGAPGADDLIAEEEFRKASADWADNPEFMVKARSAFDKAMRCCESPIEKILLPWLLFQRHQFFDFSPTVLLPSEKDAYVPGTLAIIPQLPIGRYRADFALAGSRGGLVRFVVIECDGKAFHGGVENVKRDVDRDVRILANRRVLDVVRFDGRDILSNPQACADLAARAVTEAWRKGNPATAAKFEP